MKKIITVLLTALCVFSLAACGSKSDGEENSGAEVAAGNVSDGNNSETGTGNVSEENGSGENESDEKQPETPETITITARNAAGEEAQVEVPYDPQRIAILDFAALDILDNLGLGDRVVGTATTTLDYLMSYTQKDGVALLGTIKEADLEAVMGCEPDIIFIGGRLSKYYDALNEIAPVVYLAIDTEKGVVEGTGELAKTVASIFGLEDQVDAKLADFDARIQALAAVAEGKNAMVGMCTGGSFNVLGDDGRCSIIGKEIGFNNLGNGIVSDGEQSGRGGGTSTHGNEASFELIVSLAPDYIFVMDRDAAIGTEGAKLARDIMENELVMGTDAYKNGHIVYLEHPAVWYTAEGGITALSTMLSDLESALLN